MTTAYFTFGQDHAHRVNGTTFDCDSVVKITSDDPRATMVNILEPSGLSNMTKCRKRLWTSITLAALSNYDFGQRNPHRQIHRSVSHRARRLVAGRGLTGRSLISFRPLGVGFLKEDSSINLETILDTNAQK
jgi:hypothetical protein